jgi:hypothetical protein
MGGVFNSLSQLLSKKQGPVLETDLDLNLLYYVKYYWKSLVENSTDVCYKSKYISRLPDD